MKVKDLYGVLSPYQNIQFGDSKTGEPLTYISYKADSGCEMTTYEDYKVYGIAPKVDKEGKPYLAILMDMKI